MASAYGRGYAEQQEWLNGKTLAEAEHALAERQATADPNNPTNRGATDATAHYIAERKDV